MGQQETPSRLDRVQVPALDEILGKPFHVLDDGFVRVIDYMGTDESIVQAARVSYGRGTKKVRNDRGLIRYLLRHRHTTPFEMCELKIHVRVPMDVWRQWIRHRTASVNEYSTRYSIAIDAAQRTEPDAWRMQSKGNRQGSSGLVSPEVGAELTERERAVQDACRAAYEERIGHGVAREQARKDLPLSTYTEAYWKMDLHNLLHFLALRLHESAQEEIRAYARVIGEEIVAKWCPLAWEAFEDYRLGGRFLSAEEAAIVRALATGDLDRARDLAVEADLVVTGDDGAGKLSFEGRETVAKLTDLGYTIDW
jgi:thymidylate synthase (FAD)